MRILRMFAILCAAVFATAVLPLYGQSKVYTVKTVPNVQVQDAGQYVSNPDGTLSTSAVAQINSEILDLRRTTSIEVAVVVIESIGQMPPEDFGIQLFRQWGIGKKDKDNGLLILLVTGDRIVRFEVGYGLEGVLTDAVSKRIQTTRMMPYLRSSDWDGAAIAAVEAVKEYLTDPDSDLRNEPEQVGGEFDNSSITGIALLFGFFLVIMLISWFSHRRRNKCPRCGSQMKVVDVKTAQISRDKRVTTTTLKCPKCGYTTSRNTTEHTGGGGGFIGGVGGGMLGGGMMGGFGGGRGGGGFGGGGFGGGSAGGGGATTRF